MKLSHEKLMNIFASAIVQAEMETGETMPSRLNHRAAELLDGELVQSGITECDMENCTQKHDQRIDKKLLELGS